MRIKLIQHFSCFLKKSIACLIILGDANFFYQCQNPTIYYNFSKKKLFSVCATYKSLAKSLTFSQFSTWYRKIEYDTP